MFAKVLKLSNALVEDAALYQCTVTIGEEEANKLFMLSLNGKKCKKFYPKLEAINAAIYYHMLAHLNT